ncbi:hypothetical protein [Filimonas effusa]|uniref:Beta-lactamase-inhibitor-like PepSY-like domain-containing protein n=1 Tax=Filimonas effusa TaxID=2508721 RepID=A0A4Q1D9D4_9BACT|nr:hypothetical protein [Filimonas effusa]RXK85987.1 hypothetical protein ESB13_04030 [Filimonas effusa]
MIQTPPLFNCLTTVGFLFITCLLSASCNSTQQSLQKATLDKDTAAALTGPLLQPERQATATGDTAIEVLNAEEIRLNGKLKRYFSLTQFRAVLGEPDSTKLLRDEEPCTTIFEEADGSVDPMASYLYKNGSRYEHAKDKVAIDEISFTHGDFIIYRQVSLNAGTTVDDLRKLFPNAVAHMSIMEVYEHGKLQVIQLREDNNNVSDGQIRLFLKEGKLYSMHWWFPC